MILSRKKQLCGDMCAPSGSELVRHRPFSVVATTNTLFVPNWRTTAAKSLLRTSVTGRALRTCCCQRPSNDLLR